MTPDKPKGLPYITQIAVSDLKDEWSIAQRLGDAATRRQVQIYIDKSGQAQETARQNAIEHYFSFPKDRTERALVALEDFRALATRRGLDPEEYLIEAGLPERWLKGGKP